MNSNKKTGRIVGLLFLLLIVTGSISLNLRGLTLSLSESNTFLLTVFENALNMRIAILLDFIAALIWVIIFIMLYPIFKKTLKEIHLWYFGFGFILIYFSIIVMSNISHLSLIELSQEYIENEKLDTVFYEISGKKSVQGYYLAHFFGLISYAISACALFFTFYKTKLIPQFLSVWGILAMVIVFGATWVQLLGFKVSFYFYMQNGLHIIAMTLWLLYKGLSNIQTKEVKL